jgi:hypothetical protein
MATNMGEVSSKNIGPVPSANPDYETGRHELAAGAATRLHDYRSGCRLLIRL